MKGKRKNIEMNKEKTVLQELFMQLKLQLGNNKVIQMFDEAYWLAKEQEQIEKAFDDGQDYYKSYMDDREYYKSKCGGEDVDR